jgi:hypothetical protein
MNWFFGLFLFGFCFPLHLFVGEISPSFARVPVFVVRLSKRNAVRLFFFVLFFVSCLPTVTSFSLIEVS